MPAVEIADGYGILVRVSNYPTHQAAHEYVNKIAGRVRLVQADIVVIQRKGILDRVDVIQHPAGKWQAGEYRCNEKNERYCRCSICETI